MSKSCDLSFQQRSLFQQGFQRYSPEELRQLEWGLRFTPASCSLLALYGLVNQMPYLLFAVAALGMWAFFAPAAHPMDLLYNHVIRKPFHAVALPENPFLRRLACLSAGVMNVIAGIFFLLGLPVAAYVVGGSLMVLQAIVISTHFCTLSWMYEGLMRLMGRWQVPLDEAKAKQMLTAGARLVDVRSPNEFARESIPGALNLPLEELDQHLPTFRDGVNLLFCNSGTRSFIATEKLKMAGLENIHNLGAFGRAQAIATA